MNRCVRVVSMWAVFVPGLGLSAMTSIAAQVAPTFDLHPDTDPGDQSAIERLYDVASFDRRLNMITAPLRAGAVGQLQAGVESARPSVQLSALTLLGSAVEQDVLPGGEATARISQTVGTLADSKGCSPSTDTVCLHARRVQWHLRVKALTAPANRAAFLTPLLNQVGADGVYYAYATVDYLADLGADGERVLSAFESEGAKRSIEPEIMGRAKLGLQKIALLRQVERAGPADAVSALAAAVYTPTNRQMDREFGKWVVGQLATHRPEAASQLRALVNDERVTDEVQVAARFALTDGATTIHWRW